MKYDLVLSRIPEDLLKIDRQITSERIDYALNNTIGLNDTLVAKALKMDRTTLWRIRKGRSSLEIHKMPVMVWLTGQDSAYFIGLAEWNPDAKPLGF